MLRVRDEGRMVLSSYQSLYESSIAFGMRKALMAEQHKAEMEAKVRGDAPTGGRLTDPLSYTCVLPPTHPPTPSSSAPDQAPRSRGC